MAHMRLSAAGIAGALLFGPPAYAGASDPGVASLGFEFVNTSPAASTAEELDRLQRLDGQLKTALAEPGRYSVIDTGPVSDKLAALPSPRNCNGCELDIAKSLGASFVAYGWVQKVSNLILNINLVIKDATSGRIVRADSVDVRSNTDESWQRGLRFLMNERLFPTP